MAKTSTTTGSGRGSGKNSGGGSKAKSLKAAPRKASGGAGSRSSGGSKSSGESQTNGAADALVKLIESPLVAELLAVGASAALASFAAQGFGRREDSRGTRRAFKTAAKSAATAMGQRLSTEFEAIRSAAKKSMENEAG